MNTIHWSNRLVAIRGARGVGKTTLMLQYLKLNYTPDGREALYASLDSGYFTRHTLSELVEQFYLRGGKHLFLDEVHKYPGWSREIKNAYDEYPDLRIVFSGSSLLQILNAEADLSRRCISYDMQGLSFREYLHRAKLIHLLYSDLDSLKKLQKPDKIYMENPNLLYALSLNEVNKGTVREVFMVNQLAYQHRVEYCTRSTDYTIDKKYIIETGGKSKDDKQIAGEQTVFIAADNMEYAAGNKIPLWAFGFLY